MNRGWSILSLSLLGALTTGCLDGYEPGEAWDGPYEAEGHGAAATEDEDADDAPHRTGRATRHDDDPTRTPGTADEAPEVDAECYDQGYIADGFAECDDGETFSAGCCWPTAMHACSALECGLDDCVILQSHPAQAACLPATDG